MSAPPCKGRHADAVALLLTHTLSDYVVSPATSRAVRFTETHTLGPTGSSVRCGQGLESAVPASEGWDVEPADARPGDDGSSLRVLAGRQMYGDRRRLSTGRALEDEVRVMRVLVSSYR